MSLAHTEEIITDALAVYRDVFVQVAEALKDPDRLPSRLRGQVVQPIFRNP
jgi:hypothetical protein